MFPNIISNDECVYDHEFVEAVIKLLLLDIRKILGKCWVRHSNVGCTMTSISVELPKSVLHLPISNLRIMCNAETTDMVMVQDNWYGVSVMFKLDGFTETYSKNLTVRFNGETHNLEVKQ